MSLRDTVQEVARDVIGLKANSKQDWISNTTRDLIGKKRVARLNQDKAQYKKLSNVCRKQVRQARQTWADTLALEGEERQ